MDLSKLSQNEKMALYAAIAVFLAGLISNWGGLLFLSILAAVGVAIVLFLPQLSPNTPLPASRGSLLAALGIVAFAAAAIELLIWISYILDTLGNFRTLAMLIALIASAVMAWAGWQALQREGGKWRFGTAQATATTAPAAATASAADASAPPAAPQPEAEPAAGDYDPDDDRPRDT
jgi:hypothetical protein